MPSLNPCKRCVVSYIPKYEYVYTRKLEFYPYCPNYWTNVPVPVLVGYTDTNRDTSVAVRRPKPACLVCEPTPWGYFNSKYADFKRLKRLEPPGEETCWATGQRIQYRWTYEEAVPPDRGLELKRDWEVVKDNLNTDIRNKIKAQRTCLAEFIGEWRETANAVSGGTRAIKRAYRIMRNMVRQPKHLWPIELRHLWGQRKELTHWDISGTYLAYQFGVTPWIELTEDRANRLKQRLTEPVRQVYHMTRKYQDRKVKTGACTGTIDLRYELRAKLACYVDYEVDRLEYNVGNPLEALWAGARASYLVDYFLKVGSWLSAIDALNGVKFAYGTVSFREQLFSDDKGIDRCDKLLIKPGRYRERSYRRDIYSPYISLRPEWRPTPSWGKLASSIAVLHQLQKGKKFWWNGD